MNVNRQYTAYPSQPQWQGPSPQRGRRTLVTCLVNIGYVMFAGILIFLLLSFLGINNQFIAAWTPAARSSTDCAAGKPLVFVYGLFTVAKLYEDRMLHRKTWMQSPWICNGKRSIGAQSEKAGCMHVYFVMGKVTPEHRERIRQEQERYGDIFELTDTTENMNSGKTVDWFRAARARFPTAWFVGKGDMDTYLFSDILMSQLVELPARTHHIYGGKPNDYVICAKYDHCPRGWIYMSGGFYFISQPLLQWYASPGNKIVEDNYDGPAEDLLLGRALRASGLPILYQIWPTLWEPWRHYYREKDMSVFIKLREQELNGNIDFTPAPAVDYTF